jgi:hypothetical protein
MKKLFSLCAAALTIILLLNSCSSGKIGWAHVLWSMDEAVIKTGMVLPVTAESRINSTITVKVPGTKVFAELPSWRADVYLKKAEAEAAAKNFQAEVNTYAISTRNAIPVREAKSPEAKRVYRLRENQLIKILDIDENEVTVGNLTGRWYEILTDDGTRGFAFSHALTIIEPGREKGDKVQAPDENPSMLRFISVNWIPEEYSKMIASKMLDLSVINPETGIYPDTLYKNVKVATPFHSLVFNFDKIAAGVELPESRDTSVLYAVLINENIVELTYSYKGSEFKGRYTAYAGNLKDVVSAEVKRRDEILFEFIKNGNFFSSEAYGTLRISRDTTFVWNRFNRLVPDVIPSSAQSRGTVSFHMFLSPALKQSWDGVISFNFSGTSKSSYSSFLYVFNDKGLRLQPLTEGDVRANTAERLSSPLSLFFTISQN